MHRALSILIWVLFLSLLSEVIGSAMTGDSSAAWAQTGTFEDHALVDKESDDTDGMAVIELIIPPDASDTEILAAREIRRYVYLRTGRLLAIRRMSGPRLEASEAACRILVGRQDRALMQTAEPSEPLGPQDYRLTSRPAAPDGRTPRTICVTGGDDFGVLYGAYRWIERLGVRFYLHGDTVPDRRIAPQDCWGMLAATETHRPLFALRGIQPFHDFPEGPDWWDRDQYLAVVAQLPKLRMNFIGFHVYPEGGVGPEPLVWIGPAADIDADGRVKASYPARHFTSHSGTWGYRAVDTNRYRFGADRLFDRDDYGADYMRRMTPWPKTADQENELFYRTGVLLREVFTFARTLGVKTCVGTETPLVVPAKVRRRLGAGGAEGDDRRRTQALYEGIFRRIAQTHPLDYYWFWTPENWTWQGATDEQVAATLADLQAARAAAEAVSAPFTLATCGWVLGPPRDRTLFDRVLPKDAPLSCINRNVGFAPVEPGFAAVKDRPCWAIPWMEDDPAMIIPQLWVGRLRRDAADALAYGCTGLMGIHWRTRILGPNVSALAQAGWDQRPWNPQLNGQDNPPEPEPPADLPEGRLGGKSADYASNPIDGTEDDRIFQSVCYDVRAYRLRVPNGSYKVTLQFCEIHYDQKDKRVFGVTIQDKPVIERLDLFDRVGRNRVLDYSFEDIAVTNGVLTVGFIPLIEFPAIAGIVIESEGLSRRINCGGGAYGDYQADLPDVEPPERRRDLPVADFYADWAAAQFGPEAAQPIAELFSRLDGVPADMAAGQQQSRLPRPATWVNGPGGIQPDNRPWRQVSQEYAFVEELARLRPRIREAGNLERFDYWLETFRYLQAVGKVNCTWARYNAAMEQVRREQNPAERARLARTTVLPIRRQLVADV
ncbi:MAG: hypothetical protein JW810_07790, partial [Sedimentisphaerales bacterium]|nr:hypothetical protein [Sedimentisphaerales bacterium]